MKLEAAIKDYFKAWEQNDWNSLQNYLDEDFRFTSPNGDDSIPLDAFKEKCWREAQNLGRFTIKNFAEHNNIAFVKYECIAKDNSCFQNTELFVFKNDKIKSVEVFTGRKQCPPAGEAEKS